MKNIRSLCSSRFFRLGPAGPGTTWRPTQYTYIYTCIYALKLLFTLIFICHTFYIYIDFENYPGQMYEIVYVLIAKMLLGPAGPGASFRPTYILEGGGSRAGLELSPHTNMKLL